MRSSWPTLAILFLLPALGWSCAESHPLSSVPVEPSLGLSPSSPIESSRAFEKAIRLEPGSHDFERARIDYLLEQVAKSPYNFIRNGSRYTGKRAEEHLKWKYFRNRRRVNTAEEFIDRVAFRSSLSGQFYLVELQDKKRVPLRTLLLHELGFFDHALETRREVSAKNS